MDGFDVVDLVFMIATLLFLTGAGGWLLLGSVRPSTAGRRTRKWLEREYGCPDHPRADLVRSSQTTESLVQGAGGIVGLVLTVVAFPPHFADTSSPILMWFLGFTAGFVAGEVVVVAALVRRARPPAGRRVASSRPHRINDYISRSGVVLLVLAVIIQIARIGFAQRTAGNNVHPTTTSAAMVGVVVLVVATLTVAVVTPWLVSRPLHATDDAELDVQIRLRRGRVGLLARVLYPLVLIAGPLVTQTYQDGPPGQRPPAEPGWLSLAVFGLAVGGYVLQGRFEASKQWRQADAGSRGWEPAPGTNGWINPFRPRARS